MGELMTGSLLGAGYDFDKFVLEGLFLPCEFSGSLLCVLNSFSSACLVVNRKSLTMHVTIF